MALSKKLIILLLLFGVGITVLIMLIQKQSAPKSLRPLPSYNDVLDAQFQCDKKLYEQFRFNSVASPILATKTLSVISDLKVKELPAKNKEKHHIPNRNFEISFRGMAYFECGHPAMGLDAVDGRKLLFHELICYAYKDPEHIYIFYDDPLESWVEGWTNFISNLRSTDIVPPPDTMGTVCLVTLDDFLNNPKAVNLDKLCSGESKEKREFTKKEISKAIEVLKKRQAEKRN